MSALELSREELLEIVNACSSLKIKGSPPDYLREFIARRLDATSAGLAAKVRAMDGEQMAAVVRVIEASQDVIN